MSAAPGVNLTVSPELVQPIIKEQIHSAIAQQLGNYPQLIEAVAAAALNAKVDSEGKLSSYSTYNSTPFIEWASRNAIQLAAKEALKSWLEKHQADLKAAIETHLKKNTKSIAGALVAGLIERSDNPRWMVSVSIQEKQ